MQYKIHTKNRTRTLLISLAAAVVLLIGAFILVQTLIVKGGEDDAPPTPPKYPVLEGEAEGYVYPVVDITKINYISIDNEKSEYEFVRAGDTREFHLRYKNSKGEWALYYPDICFLDDSFSYSSLYATDPFGEGGSIARIYYLALAVGMVAFNERIELPTVPEGAEESEAQAIRAEREALLAEYGFDDSKTAFRFNYTAEDGTAQSHSVTLGDRVVTGAGRYVLVDGRNYIYATATDTIEYTREDHIYFIKGTLVAPGLPQDASYEPYLTTGFRQYRNSKIAKEGALVSKGSTVSVGGSLIAPVVSENDSDGVKDGYTKTDLSSTLFDLSSHTEGDYQRLVTLLEGKPIGSYTDAPLIFTLVGDGASFDFGKQSSYAYSYTVSAVESILTETEEITASGTRPSDVSAAKYIKVTYTYSIGGVLQNDYPSHALIPLDSPLLPADTKEALMGVEIGEACAVSFDIAYTESTANKNTLKYVLSEILIIETAEGVHQKEITETSIVTYRYYILNGSERSETYTATINLSLETDEMVLSAKAKLLGLAVGPADQLVLMQHDEYTELMLDFATYEFDTVAYFLEKELIVSFKFANMSERNPFYGESIYQNLTGGKNGLYGLNETTCESAVKLLGGLGANSSASVGLWGQTVALGITPELLDEYGLYAYTVYFELPRGITEIELDGIEDTESDGKIDKTSSYFWYSTLGFTLYVSEEDEEGYRYVASDLYDVIVKVEGTPFKFLKYGFVDFWARRTMLMVDISAIERIQLEMRMANKTGTYDFALSHAYHDLPSGDVYDQLIVHLTPNGDYNAAVLKQYLTEKGKDTVKLDDFYNDVLGGGSTVAVGRDYAGTGYFKELMRMIYFITYTGICTDEEMSATDGLEPLMRFSFDIPDSSLYFYTYEFFRISDRQVVVRLSQTNSEGEYVGEPVEDFYISTGAFKMIVNAFDSLFAAKPVDAGANYG